MSSSLRGTVVHFVRQVFHGHLDQASDAELLDRFIQRREEEAFASLVFRHQQLVFAVCYRTLANVQDAEDAFQATFLTLAKKCRSVRNKICLGTWLYQVAYRASVRLQKQKLRQSSVELASASRSTEAGERSSNRAETQDEARVVHEEINRLPEKYRVVVVSCYLEGKSCTQVAEELGQPRGTISTRLNHARNMLRGRLTYRGVSLSLAGLATTLSCSESLSKQVVANVVRASISNMKAAVANELVTPTAALLTRGVIDEMYGHITKRLSILAIVLGALAIGGFVWYSQSTASVPIAQATGEGKKATQKDGNKRTGKPKTDQEKIQGMWVGVSIKGAPVQDLEDIASLYTFTFKGNKVDILFGGQLGQGTFKLDPTKTPKQIDILITNKERMNGIYKLTGNRLVISGSGANNKRPTDFNGEQPNILMTLRRTTKKEQAMHRECQKKFAILLKKMRRFQEEALRARALAEAERARALAKLQQLQVFSPTRLVGALKKIDIEKNTAAIVIKGTSLELKPVPIHEDCKFYMGNKKCSIDDYKSGMAVRFSLQTKDNVTRITEIRATPKKKK